MRILAVGFAVYVTFVIAASALGVYVLLPVTADLRTIAAAPAPAPASVAAADAASAPEPEPVPDEPPAPVIATAAEDPPDVSAETSEPEAEWSPATKLGLAIDLILAERAPEIEAAPTELALVPAASIAVPPVATAATPVAAVPAPEVAMLLQRGEALLATGDVAAARLFFGRAAERGDAAGAIGLAKTYDPLFLAQAGFRTARGDAAQAATWYRRAIAGGHADAAARLDRLLAAAQPKS